jgi:nucleoside-diphosphate-sugar epimerase
VIVVTGATGFVGRHVVEAWLDRGEEVACLVRGPAPELAELPGVLLRRWQDVHDWRGLRPTAVVHLAAAGVQPAGREPTALEAGNRQLTLSLLEVARDWPLQAFVHVGSCAEYGRVGPELVREDRSAPRPEALSPYGAAKWQASLAALEFAKTHGLPLVVARPFNVFGPGEAPARLLPYLVGQLRRGQPADLTPGTQVRDFVYVADVAEALLALSEADLPDPTVVNVCSGRGHSVREVVDRMAALLGAPVELLRWGALPARGDEPPVLVGDPTRLQALTGWRPRTPLDAALVRFLEAHG